MNISIFFVENEHFINEKQKLSLISARNNDIDLFTNLLNSKELDPYVIDAIGNNVLMYLVMNHQEELAIQILEEYPNINYKLVNKLGNTIMMIACFNNMERFAIKLYNKLKIYSQSEIENYLNLKNRYGNTVLIYAINKKMNLLVNLIIRNNKITEFSFNRMNLSIFELLINFNNYQYFNKLFEDLKNCEEFKRYLLIPRKEYNNDILFVKLVELRYEELAIKLIDINPQIVSYVSNNFNKNTSMILLASYCRCEKVIKKIIDIGIKNRLEININLEDGINHFPLVVILKNNLLNCVEQVLNYESFDLSKIMNIEPVKFFIKKDILFEIKDKVIKSEGFKNFVLNKIRNNDLEDFISNDLIDIYTNCSIKSFEIFYEFFCDLKDKLGFCTYHKVKEIFLTSSLTLASRYGFIDLIFGIFIGKYKVFEEDDCSKNDDCYLKLEPYKKRNIMMDLRSKRILREKLMEHYSFIDIEKYLILEMMDYLFIT